MNVVKLIQGSAEWHAHRAKYRNASETAAVMGASPWLTPLALWELRTGRRQPETNAAMARGTALEPRARDHYERLTGTVMQPLVLVDGEYSASLDGLSFDGSLAVEIKCPVRGKDSTLWRQVESGQVPEHYSWQVEHQLMVCGARSAHLFVYDEGSDSGLIHEIKPVPERWEAIRSAWDAFMHYVQTDTPPALSARDKVQRDDETWRKAAAEFLLRRQEAEIAAEKLDQAKAALIELQQAPSEAGHGVLVTRFWKQGSVDYKKVPQLQGVDLTQYRGKAREEVRVTISPS
jgi:putative phage-type endonuclease